MGRPRSKCQESLEPPSSALGRKRGEPARVLTAFVRERDEELEKASVTVDALQEELQQVMRVNEALLQERDKAKEAAC